MAATVVKKAKDFSSYQEPKTVKGSSLPQSPEMGSKFRQMLECRLVNVQD